MNASPTLSIAAWLLGRALRLYHWPRRQRRHIATQEQLDGKVVEWMEQVSDEQYQAGSKVR
jgi:hypothetical protein